MNRPKDDQLKTTGFLAIDDRNLREIVFIQAG